MAKRLYTREQYLSAYAEWAMTDPDDQYARSSAWDKYCDMRDNVPLGTSKMFRIYGDRFLAAAAMGTIDA